MDRLQKIRILIEACEAEIRRNEKKMYADMVKIAAYEEVLKILKGEDE